MAVVRQTARAKDLHARGRARTRACYEDERELKSKDTEFTKQCTQSFTEEIHPAHIPPGTEILSMAAVRLDARAKDRNARGRA